MYEKFSIPQMDRFKNELKLQGDEASAKRSMDVCTTNTANAPFYL